MRSTIARHAAAGALLGLALVGCARTSTSRAIASQIYPEYHGVEFEKVFALADFTDLHTRSNTEKAFVEEIERLGSGGLRGSEYMYKEERESGEVTIQAARWAGADSVLYLFVKRKGLDKRYVPAGWVEKWGSAYGESFGAGSPDAPNVPDRRDDGDWVVMRAVLVDPQAEAIAWECEGRFRAKKEFSKKFALYVARQLVADEMVD